MKFRYIRLVKIVGAASPQYPDEDEWDGEDDDG
jgi:hypothetical protein